MDSPVDIFKPAVIVLASNEDSIVFPSENSAEFRLETINGDSTSIIVDVGRLIKVVVGPSSVAFLGTKAIQLMHNDSKSLQTFDNDKLFVDITWESHWHLASKAETLETYKLTDGPELSGNTDHQGDYMEFRDGLFYSTTKVCGFTVSEQSVSYGSVCYNGHEPILSFAASGDLVALGFEKRIVVLNKENYEEIPIRNMARALTFYDDELYLCHNNGVSQVEYGDFSEKITSETADDSPFKGNICGFAVHTLEPTPETASGGNVISLAEHEHTVAELQAQISKLKSELSLCKAQDEPIVPSTSLDTRFETANFPTSISDAFAQLFNGQDLYYYFEIKQKELAEYLAGTDPVRAQLLRLTLINDFPSSVLADKLVAELGPVVAAPDVFEAVMGKYHVYEQYKAG